MTEIFFHGGELKQKTGFAFWARRVDHVVDYSDGKTLMVLSLDIDIVEDGIDIVDIEDLDPDEILEQQYNCIAELLAEGAEAVGCSDGIAIPHIRTVAAERVSIERAYEIEEHNEK